MADYDRAKAEAALDAWGDRLPYRFQIGDRVCWRKHPTFPYIVVWRGWVVRPRPGTLKWYFADRRLRYCLQFDGPGGGKTPMIDEDDLELDHKVSSKATS
jgi:hypothetical protein